MAELLFRLRHVTDEEAMEVRDLLAAHGFLKMKAFSLHSCEK